MKVMASDADDPTYGSSARIVYSVLDGEKFFTVDRQTGKSICPWYSYERSEQHGLIVRNNNIHLPNQSLQSRA